MGRRRGGSHGYSPEFTSGYNYNYININTVNVYKKLLKRRFIGSVLRMSSVAVRWACHGIQSSQLQRSREVGVSRDPVVAAPA